MHRRLFGAAAGMALLASVGVASAGERATLTDTQLDKVVAGNFAVVTANGIGVTTSNGTFVIQSNTTNATAEIFANWANTGAGATHTLSLSAATAVP